MLASTSLPFAAAVAGGRDDSAPARKGLTMAVQPQDGGAFLTLDAGADDSDTVLYGDLAGRARRGPGFVRERLFVPDHKPLLAMRISRDDLDTIKQGLGIDLTLPDVGNFHLNLYTRRNARRPGKRWALSPGPEPLGAAGRSWSLGGSLDLQRTTLGGSRELVFVPQLLLDVDALTGAPGKLEATLQYAHWRSFSDKHVTSEDALPQVTFKWSF